MSRIGFLLTAVLLVPAGAARAEEFNWDNMLFLWIKLNKDFQYSDRNVDSYMQAHRRDVWDEVRNNEFKHNRARKETIDIMKRRAEEAKLEEEVVLHTTLEFAKYDSDLESFPLSNMTDTHYWRTYSRNYADRLPGSFSVFFSNPKPFALMKMDETKAEAFLKARTDRFGGINRRVDATIRLRIQKLKDKDQGNKFVAQILNVTLYHDKTKTKVLAEMTEKPSSEEKDK